jgi:hypothetical protein
MLIKSTHSNSFYAFLKYDLIQKDKRTMLGAKTKRLKNTSFILLMINMLILLSSLNPVFAAISVDVAPASTVVNIVTTYEFTITDITT